MKSHFLLFCLLLAGLYVVSCKPEGAGDAVLLLEELHQVHGRRNARGALGSPQRERHRRHFAVRGGVVRNRRQRHRQGHQPRSRRAWRDASASVRAAIVRPRQTGLPCDGRRARRHRLDLGSHVVPFRRLNGLWPAPRRSSPQAVRVPPEPTPATAPEIQCARAAPDVRARP